ncbi:hypothetical protein ACSSS7_006130 [Eimeria intestinalis]
MAGGPLAQHGAPAAKGSRAKAKTLSLLRSAPDPLKPYGGVHTFLRIRPPSPSSAAEPPCIGYLCAPREATNAGPHVQLEPPQGSSLLAAAPQGSPSPLVTPGQPHIKNLSALPSLTIGRTRTVTSLPVEDEPLLKKALEAPPRGPPSLVGAHEASARPAVMVLPASVERIAAPSEKAQRLNRRRPSMGAPLSIAADAYESAVGRPELAFGSLPVCGKGCMGQKGFEGPFEFGGLLQPHATQDAVFERVGRPAAEALLQGLNACIAVHGASGSGKTYTMVGPHDGTSNRLHRRSTSSSSSSSWGLALRTIDFVMRALEARQKEGNQSKASPEVWFSAAEVYCAKLRDLLGPPKDPQAELRSSSLVGGQPTSDALGLSMPTGVLGAPRPLRVHSAAEAVSAALRAFTQRVSRETAANSSSSRSHAILTLSVAYPGASPIGSRLYLLDLAGAERQQYAETWETPHRAAPASQSSRLRPPPKALLALEAASISKSLTAFMSVIADLGRHCAAAKLRGGYFRKFEGRTAPQERSLQPKCESSKAIPVKGHISNVPARPSSGPLEGSLAVKRTLTEQAAGLRDLSGAPGTSLQAQPSDPAVCCPGKPSWVRGDTELEGTGRGLSSVNNKGDNKTSMSGSPLFLLLRCYRPFSLKGSRGPTNGDRGLVLKGQRLTPPGVAPAPSEPNSAKLAPAPSAAATAAPPKATKLQPPRARRPLAVRAIATAAGVLPRIQRGPKTPSGPTFHPSANFVSLPRKPSLLKLRSDSAAATLTSLTATAEPREHPPESLSKQHKADESSRAAPKNLAKRLSIEPLILHDGQAAIRGTKETTYEKISSGQIFGGAPAEAKGLFSDRRRSSNRRRVSAPVALRRREGSGICCCRCCCCCCSLKGPSSAQAFEGTSSRMLHQPTRVGGQRESGGGGNSTNYAMSPTSLICLSDRVTAAAVVAAAQSCAERSTYNPRCMQAWMRADVSCDGGCPRQKSTVSSQASANTKKLPGSSSAAGSPEAPAAPPAAAAAAAAASSADQTPRGAAAAIAGCSNAAACKACWLGLQHQLLRPHKCSFLDENAPACVSPLPSPHSSGGLPQAVFGVPSRRLQYRQQQGLQLQQQGQLQQPLQSTNIDASWSRLLPTLYAGTPGPLSQQQQHQQQRTQRAREQQQRLQLTYGTSVQLMETSAAASTEEEVHEKLKGPSTAALAAAAARAAAAVAGGVTLQLTPGEQHLFSSLNNCVRDKKLNIELRAAGGWVRDKLLGIPSKDIDIAIDNMTGAAFADVLNDRRAYGVISKRVEQSKHLETATMRLFSFDLDLVNLRSEDYSSDSRIPTVTTLGTPLEDAARRDFCCNALFYNLRSGLVEDWLGKGLTDLKRGLVRAAHVCPYTTLRDDPLRLLRGVRFAVALRFKLHAPLLVAAAAAGVREALGAKVARERIGIELKKIFSLARAGSAAAAAAEAVAEESKEAATAPATPEATDAAKLPAAATSGDDLLQEPLNAALRGVLLLQQMGLWDIVVSLTEGQEVYRQPEEEQAPSQEGGASAAGKKRLGQKAFVQMLKTTQTPLSIKEECPLMDSLGASCLLALRHLLARGPLLQQLGRENERAEAGAAASSETETAKACEALSQGLEFQGDVLRQMLFAAVLHPLRGLLAICDVAPRVRPLAGSIVSSSWRLPSGEAAAVENLIENAALLRAAADRGPELQQQEQQQPERVRLGLLVRKAGPHWSAALVLAAAEALGGLIFEDTAAAVAAASAALRQGRTVGPFTARAVSAAEEDQGGRERKRSSEREGPPDQKKLCCSEGAPLTGCTLPHDGAPKEAGAANGEADEVAPEAAFHAASIAAVVAAATPTVAIADRTLITAIFPAASGPKLGEIMEAQAEGPASRVLTGLKVVVNREPIKPFSTRERISNVEFNSQSSHRSSFRQVSAVNPSRPRRGKPGPRGAPRGSPCFGPSSGGRRAVGRDRDRNGAINDQISFGKIITGLSGPAASRCLHHQERFPRPDLDLEALREEQQHAHGATQWHLVTTTRNVELGEPEAAVGSCNSQGPLPSGFAPRSGVPGFPVSSDEGGTSRLSAGEQLEKIRADRRAQRSPSPCFYDGGSAPSYEGRTAIGVEQRWPSEETSHECSSPKATETFFSEVPTDWRLEITEDFDDEWARLSGGPWDEDAGGPPCGPAADRLEDKRLKVFVSELGGAPKAVAALNRFQVLGVLENPPRALGLCVDQRGPHGAPSSLTLPPEVYEALVERMTNILPSFDRQQLLRLILLQQQHVHALQHQYLMLLQRARTLRLHAAVAAQQEQQQQQQHLQLAAAQAVESQVAADAAKRGLKALQQRQFLDHLFDALLPHLAVLVLHAVDRVAGLHWAPLSGGESKPKGLAGEALMVLGPLVVGSLRVVALEAARCHRSPEAPGSSSFDIEGPLADTGEAPEETGGALGFACRRLLEAVCQGSELQELRFLPRDLLLRLLLCCCLVGSGASSAAYQVAEHCINFLLEGLHGDDVLRERASGSAASLELREVTLEEATTILISCSYLEARGGAPTWQLPLFKQLLRALSFDDKGSRGHEGTLQLCIESNEAVLGPPLLPHCSPGFLRSGSRPAPLLSNQHIETLIGVIDEAMPSCGLLEDAFSGSSLLREDTEQLMQGTAVDGCRSFPEMVVDENVDVEGALEEWAIRVEVRSPREPSSGSTFDYLDEDEGASTQQVKEVAIPAAVALAATEAVAWALSRLLQQQQKLQAEQKQQQQQEPVQQERLQESIRKALSLLALLASRLATSTEDPRVFPPALIQGAHALADAAENLLSAFAPLSHRNVLQTRELRVATLSLLRAEARLLLTAAARAARRGDVPRGCMQANTEALCCCISRSLGALGVLGPHAHCKEKSLDGDAERAAAADFVTAAKACLRCCRPATWLHGTQQTSKKGILRLSLGNQAQLLRSWAALLDWCLQKQLPDDSEAIHLKEISEEAAHAVVSAAAAWGHPEESSKLLQAQRAPQAIVGALEAFVTCARSLLRQSLFTSCGRLAVSPEAAASATTGLERMLKQLSRLCPLVSECELRAASEVARRLQQLQQELVQKKDFQTVSVSLAKSPREVLRKAVEALDTGLLERLTCNCDREGRQKAPQSQLKMKQTLNAESLQG